MANRMNVGQKFEDFSVFENAIRLYQNAKMSSLDKRGPITIAAAQSRLSNKTLDENLKYY